MSNNYAWTLHCDFTPANNNWQYDNVVKYVLDSIMQSQKPTAESNITAENLFNIKTVQR